ncbi:hypothetical protein [Levilactobacillus suantsaii]
MTVLPGITIGENSII